MLYSNPCKLVKIRAKIIVEIRLIIACVLKLQIIAWWHQVAVHPERSNINVFKIGICQGFKTLTPLGGHIEPISIAGDKLLWKKAQKKAQKNKISDTINKIVP
jgi:hypothetical protein